MGKYIKMKECTLGLIYVCKAIEFVLQVGWALYTIYEGLTFMSKLDRESGETYLIVLTIICMVLAGLQVLFHNFVINCRFYMRLRCETCCSPMYTVLSILCCDGCTKKVCRDRCFTAPTLVKWFVVYAPVFSVMFFLTNAWNKSQ